MYNHFSWHILPQLDLKYFKKWFFQFFPDLRLGKENFTSKKYWNISKFGDFVVVQGLVQSTRYLALFREAGVL